MDRKSELSLIVLLIYTFMRLAADLTRIGWVAEDFYWIVVKQSGYLDFSSRWEIFMEFHRMWFMATFLELVLVFGIIYAIISFIFWVRKKRSFNRVS